MNDIPSVADSTTFKIRKFIKYRSLGGLLSFYIAFFAMIIIYYIFRFISLTNSSNISAYDYVEVIVISIEIYGIINILNCVLKRPVNSIFKVRREISLILLVNILFCVGKLSLQNAEYTWYSLRHTSYFLWWAYFMFSQRVSYYFSIDNKCSTKILYTYFVNGDIVSMKPWQYHKYIHSYDAMTYYLMLDLNTESTYFEINNGKPHNDKLYSDIYYCFYMALAAGLKREGVKNRLNILRDIDCIREYSIRVLSSLSDIKTENESRKRIYSYFGNCNDNDLNFKKTLREMLQRVELDHSFSYYAILDRFSALFDNVIYFYESVQNQFYCHNQFIMLNCMCYAMMTSKTLCISEEKLVEMYYNEWCDYLSREHETISVI